MKKQYKPMSKGLGILDWIKRKTSMKPGTLVFGQAAFKSLVWSAPLSKIPVIGQLYKALIMFNDRRTTQGYAIPLNIDVSTDLRPMTVPIDLMEKAVREASYRAAMNSCICRDTYRCENYPHELGCIFLGTAGRICVENGIAHEATVEECIDRIHKAAALGLSGQSYWIEVESFIWGFQNEDMDKFIELCFCCPCCCVGKKFMMRADNEARLLFQRSIGYVATVTDACVNCGKCISVCPRLAIKQGVDGVVITEDCGGCGICVAGCPVRAIQMKLEKPLKNNLEAYYESIDLKL